VSTEESGDGWCVRDAFCKLFGWEHCSDERSRLVEASEGQDTPRLAEHLGLTLFEVPKDWNELIHRHAHPGIAVFAFPAYQMSHVVYVHDVQWLLHHWTHDGQPIRPGALWSCHDPQLVCAMLALVMTPLLT
jgi:hypothetical protein